MEEILAGATTVNQAAVGQSAVLVVDDEPGVRESLRFLLSPSYRVRTVSSGEEALEALRTEPIDVVLLDLTMPGIGGVETLGRIREIDQAVEVVIITGFFSYQSAVEALRLRAFDYITKPLDSGRVQSVVRRAEASRWRRREEPTGDRYESLTRQTLELLDALAIERPAGFSEMFFVKLDYVRLLAQSMCDRVGGDPLTLGRQLADAVDELELFVPDGLGDVALRALERVRGFVRSLAIPS
jgi:FixJ family two-component response regulator